MYFVAYVVVIIGLIAYFWYSARESLITWDMVPNSDLTFSAAEDQAELAPEAPKYVQERREDLRGPQTIAGNV